MDNHSPIHTLRTQYFKSDLKVGFEKEEEKVPPMPPVKNLTLFRNPQKEPDPNELIESRFLYRGGICLLLGPTGVGKSSLLMQLGVNFAMGKSLFGITPGKTYREKGMRILLIQAENDEGDIAEMRDGVMAGCELTEEEAETAWSRIDVCTSSDETKDRFAKTLGNLLTWHGPYDLVMMDPAFAYLGGDSNSQKDVSHFMRNLLNPLLQRHKVGLILAHHTNKPLRGKEKDSWAAGDYAYLGAGSAEWINPSRAALALRSIGSDSVFELRAPKRGKRLGWQDENDVSTVSQFISHHREPGVICWRQAEPSEVEELMAEDKGGRPRTCDLGEILHCVLIHPDQSQGFYKELVSQVIGCSEQAVQRSIQQCVQDGWIRYKEQGRKRLYRATEKGQKQASDHPCTYSWKNY